MKSRTLIHGLLAVLLIAVSLSLSACGSNDHKESGSVMMADHSSMPLMVRQAPQRVQEAYRFAAANPEALKQMPCYCGCGPIGHDSNYACFFRKDGLLDTHGLGCGICVEIAHDVMRGMQQGMSLAQIRTQVDADYSRYGPPTDTPPVVSR
ncbi:MAG: hypothetical protein KF893_10900 [Caldilineaceae bacterium]|nr:hypothetical protein [Caldilineaceae bacterium]